MRQVGVAAGLFATVLIGLGATGMYPISDWFAINVARSSNAGQARTNLGTHLASSITAGTFPLDVAAPPEVKNLQRFWTNVASSGPLVVGALGDSVGAAKYHWLIRDLISKRGFGGYVYRGYTVGGTVNFYSTKEVLGTGGTVGRNSTWPLSHDYIGASSSLSYGILSNAAAAPIYADRLKVVYKAGAGQGTFDIRTAFNGGSWTTQTTVDASKGSGVLATNLAVTAGNYRLRITTVSGTNEIIGTGIWNNSSNNVVVCVLDNAPEGLDVSSGTSGIFSGDTNALNTVLTDADLDLLFVEFKDRQTISDSVYSNGVERLAAVLSNYVKGSVCWIGTTPDIYANQTVNWITKQAARRNTQTYWDGEVPVGSTNYMAQVGWWNDGVHPTTNCQNFLAQLLIRDLGLDRLISGQAAEAITVGKLPLSVLPVITSNQIDSATDSAYRGGAGAATFSDVFWHSNIATMGGAIVSNVVSADKFVSTDYRRAGGNDTQYGTRLHLYHRTNDAHFSVAGVHSPASSAIGVWFRGGTYDNYSSSALWGTVNSTTINAPSTTTNGGPYLAQQNVNRLSINSAGKVVAHAGLISDADANVSGNLSAGSVSVNNGISAASVTADSASIGTAAVGLVVGDMSGGTNANPATLFAPGSHIPPQFLGTGELTGSRFLRVDGTFVLIEGGGDVLKANNLSDMVDAGASRTNIGAHLSSNLRGVVPNELLSSARSTNFSWWDSGGTIWVSNNANGLGIGVAAASGNSLQTVGAAKFGGNLIGANGAKFRNRWATNWVVSASSGNQVSMQIGGASDPSDSFPALVNVNSTLVVAGGLGGTNVDLASMGGFSLKAKADPPEFFAGFPGGATLWSDGTNLCVILKNPSTGALSTNKVTLSAWP